jgi:parallel beta-helix repeat protein
MALIVLLVCVLALVHTIQPVKAHPEIIISYNGDPVPDDGRIQRDGTRYTLTCSIDDNIVIEHCDNIVLDGAFNRLHGDGLGSGILLWYCQAVAVTNVYIDNFIHGIELQGDPGDFTVSSENSIYGCSIVSNSIFGIFLAFSTHNSIYDNRIERNQGGGIHMERSSDNYIWHNCFIDNDISQASGFESTNIWDDGYPSGGNYWSDYAGVDDDLDGIGDTPYSIIENTLAYSFDHYPLVPHIRVDPGESIFFSHITPLHSVFSIAIRVSHVVNVYGWQVCLTYNPEFLTCTRAWHPTEDEQYVFHGMEPCAPVGPVLGANYVLIGDCLVGQRQGFTGSGLLCTIEFEIIAEPPQGSFLACILDISQVGPFETYLLDPLFYEVPAARLNGNYEYWDLQGDVNGDGRVDIMDIVIAAIAYGAMPGDLNWNPIADVAPPYGHINILDLVVIAAHYGEVYP